ALPGERARAFAVFSGDLLDGSLVLFARISFLRCAVEHVSKMLRLRSRHVAPHPAHSDEGGRWPLGLWGQGATSDTVLAHRFHERRDEFLGFVRIDREAIEVGVTFSWLCVCG